MAALKWIHAACVVGFVLSLGSCTQKSSEQQLFDDYRSRLTRVLAVDAIEPQVQDAIVYPRRRALTLELAPVRLDILEFLKLSPCPLQRLIGERNSSLGQVMSHSQQWFYEARFIVSARECLRYLLASPKHVELQTTVQSALEVKLKQRYRVTWNATFASREFQRLFSQSSDPVSLAQARPGELVDALGQLRWLLERWHNFDIVPDHSLERQYQLIGADQYMGQLQLALMLANAQLRAWNGLQQARLSGRPLCFNGRSNRAGDALHGVFLKFYIGQVQPYLAKLYQQGDSVISELDTLKSASKLETSEYPRAFDDYWQQTWDVTRDHSLWSEFKVLLRDHTLNWQAQLKQCGLMPGS